MNEDLSVEFQILTRKISFSRIRVLSLPHQASLHFQKISGRNLADHQGKDLEGKRRKTKDHPESSGFALI